ncbi:hypothetical protein Naga_100026g16 [Nannochloropsis gaditana]|uniref:Uncharacterized protein n=1 Tax=Nannochloropsis gaditana TaxID=72520 RepID=W7TW96_9STRA|nr:hypothetical protein Naga_100026g16 [Nannochloropsis gaditana]
MSFGGGGFGRTPFGGGGNTGTGFGTSTPGGGFGGAQTTPAFGASQTPAFGGPTTQTPSAQGGFGTTGGFGQTSQGGFGSNASTVSPFGGGAGATSTGFGAHHDNNSSAPTYIQAITAMEAYKEKSFEELRTPSAFPSSTGVGATTPSFSFSSPNVTLGGSMQFSQQQQSLQQPQSSLQLQQQQQQQSPFQQQQFYTPQSEQRPFQILMSSSGGRRAALKPEAFDATPPSLQQYRDTPRSAAKLLPRGLRTGALETALGRGPAAASRGGRSGMEEDFPNMVSPASDSFPGRSHKHLVIDQDDIFAAESKIFDLDELPGRDRLVDANGASGTPGGGNPLQRSSSGGGGSRRFNREFKTRRHIAWTQ